MIPMVFVAGYSNSGKTTVLVEMVKILKSRGYRVAVIKHAAHGYDFDVPGKDSHRCFEAGADSVVVVGPDSLLVHERCEVNLTLKDVCSKITGVDLIIVEGFKRSPGPKIEVLRKGFPGERLSGVDGIIAMVSDKPSKEKLPSFSTDKLEELTDYVLDYLEIPKDNK